MYYDVKRTAGIIKELRKHRELTQEVAAKEMGINIKTYQAAEQGSRGLSIDSGLYFDELQEEEQPGLHIRRISGKELSDDEMIQYYASLARQHGGKITGRYRNAIYFILDENHHYSSMDMSIATEPFILTDVPHLKTIEGFPLDLLSIDISTGKFAI